MLIVGLIALAVLIVATWRDWQRQRHAARPSRWSPPPRVRVECPDCRRAGWTVSGRCDLCAGDGYLPYHGGDVA